VWPIQGTVPGATFEYHSSLTLSEEYNDNFNVTTSSQGKQSNWRTTLSPGSTILFNGAKTHGSITASTGLTYDSSTSTDSYNVYPNLSASVQHQFTPRLSLTLTDTFNRNDNPTTVDSSGLRQQRQTYISNTFGASVNWLIDLLQTQYYYRNSYFSNTGTNNTTSSSQGNSTPNTNQGDSTTTSQIFGLSASTRLGALNTVTAGYEYSISEPNGNQGSTSYGNLFTASLSHQLGTYASAGIQGSYATQTLDDVKIWNGSVFGTYGLPSGFSFSGSVGYSIVDSDVVSNQSGWSGNGQVTYAHARGSMGLGVFQDYRTTYQGGQLGQSPVDLSGQNFGIVQTTGVTANFSYRLGPIINSFMNASYIRNSNTGIGNDKSSPNQDYFTVTGGLTWPMLRWLSMSLLGSHVQYNHPDRTVNTATLSVTAGF
jgi:hypothetical protein